MTRKFTKMMAAVALLTFLAVPMGMWGQTSDVQVLTNANIVAAGEANNGYQSWTITDGNSNEWEAYAIKNKHSNATSSYHYLQIKKYASNTAYYIQVPELGTQIISITMTVSGSSQPMTGGGNTATLYFSNSNSTSSTGTGVASGTDGSSVTIDCSDLNLNSGYITASGAVRIWDVSVTYTADNTPSIYAEDVNIEYGATSGSIAYTINNGVEGGSLSAAVTEGNWLTLDQGTASPISFACSANNAYTARTATVTLTYTYGRNQVTKDVTVTQGTLPLPTITAADVNITYDTEFGYITYTINNPANGGSITASATSDWFEVNETPDQDGFYFICDDNTNGAERAATVTLTYTYGESQNATKNVTVTQAAGPNAPGTQNNPYTVAQARAAIDANTGLTNVYARGIVSTAGTLSNGAISYYISDDGTTTDQLQAYKGKGINGADFTSSDDIQKGDVVVIYGTLKKYNSIYEFDSGNQLVSLARPSITVANATVNLDYTEHNGTLNLSYEDLTINDMTDFHIQYYDAQGEEADEPDWIEVTVAEQDPSVGEGYVVSYFLLENEGAARTAYFKVYSGITYSNLVTVTQAVAPVTYSYSINGTESLSNPSTFGATITLNDGVNLNGDFTFAGWTTDPNDVSERLTGSTILNASHTTFYAVYEHTTTLGGTSNLDSDASYVKVTSTDDITDGNYLIVYEDGLVAFDGGLNSFDATENTIEVEITNGQIASSTEVMAAAFTIAEMEGGYSIKGTSGKYISVNGYSNGLVSSETPAANAIDFENDNVLITRTFDAGTMTLKFNSASNQLRFRYYKSGQQDIQLYKYTGGGSTPVTTKAYYTRVFLNEVVEDDIEIVGPSIIPSGQILNMGEDYAIYNSLENESFIIEDGAQLFTILEVEAATVQKRIAAHGTSEGWNFIASPTTGAVTPNEGNGIINGTVGENNNTYDLYYYEEPTHLWKNYESVTFNIQPQKGYLYANSVETILSFAGELQSSYEAITIPANNLGCSASELTGFNLVGNPFPCNATLNRPYYVINGMALEACSEINAINPCTGAMVQITDANKVVTFTPVEPTAQTPQPNQLQLTVAQQVVTRSGMNSQVNDNAIINFNAGSQLEKFAFNADAAKLYIPQNGKDFAIVSAEGQGEMPVNFRAAKNGTYTLTVNPEGVEMNYLHLIDNMTGNDVDLLATPSYTFNATTRDYESRFRLVFAANNENGVSTGSATFAYFSNGSLVVNNEGNATLQVVDVMGRIVKSESINGSASINVNAAPGVYMLRLINGNDVRTQKIVVR